MEKTIEEIQEEIEKTQKQQSEMQMKAVAEAEAQQKAMAEFVSDPAKALQTKLNLKVAEHIDQSDEVSKQVESSAERIVEKGLSIQRKKFEAEEKRVEKEKNDAEYELAESKFRAFGHDSMPEKKWQQKIIDYGYNVWFVIMFVVCFFSIAPIYIFLDIIKSQKGVLKVFAIVVGVVLLIGCLAGLTYACLKWSGLINT